MRARLSPSSLATLAVASLTLAAPALAGPDWIEVGDAGSSLPFAQRPLRPPGAPALQTISGTLNAGLGDFEDLYFVNVVDPMTFSIATGMSNFDSVLYLFNITINREALGLLGNDDQATGNALPRLVGAATDGTGVVISAPGDYLLAVTGRGRSPLSSTGAIFNLATFTEISGPDGPGGFNALSGWTGSSETGTYGLVLNGVDFPIYPAPGTVALTLMAAAAAARRRR